MKQFRIKITKTAAEDMEGIYRYIAEDRKVSIAAMNQYNRIIAAIERLDTFPERIKVIASEFGVRHQLRQMLVDHYSGFFTIREDVIIVARVLYSTSDIRQRLEEGE